MDGNGNVKNEMDDKLQNLFNEMKLVYASKLTDEVKALNTEINALKSDNVALKKNYNTLECENRMLREGIKRRDDTILTSADKLSSQLNDLTTLKSRYGHVLNDIRDYQANAKALEDAASAIVSKSKAMSSSWEKCRQRLHSVDASAGQANGPTIRSHKLKSVDLDDADLLVSAQDDSSSVCLSNSAIKIRIVSDNGKLISVPHHAGNGRAKDGVKIEEKTEASPNKRNRRSTSAAAEGAFLCSENGCGRTFKRKCTLQDHVRDSHCLMNY